MLVDAASGSDVTLRNIGSIDGDIRFNNGDDRVVNRGDIEGNVDLGSGDDLYRALKNGDAGEVYGGDGDDVLLGAKEDDLLFGGADDDLLKGRKGDDDLDSGSGANRLVGGGGDDTITIDSGDYLTDTVHGGWANGADNSENDTLIVSGGSAVNIFLTEGKVASVAPGNALVARTSGFENATGSFQNDALFGDTYANILDGGDGADWLAGGGGVDTFQFSDIFFIDAGEQIADFDDDIIDFSRIDANTAATTDDAFAFRTVHTANAAAEVVMTSFGGAGARLDFYVDANNTIDAELFVTFDNPAQPTLTAEDFML